MLPFLHLSAFSFSHLPFIRVLIQLSQCLAEKMVPVILGIKVIQSQVSSCCLIIIPPTLCSFKQVEPYADRKKWIHIRSTRITLYPTHNPRIIFCLYPHPQCTLSHRAYLTQCTLSHRAYYLTVPLRRRVCMRIEDLKAATCSSQSMRLLPHL